MRAEFMSRALHLAAENVRTATGGPFAAVIVREGEVLAEGVNLVTSTCDPTAHAEVVAIREACRKAGDFQLRGCEIYSSCEPCPMCLAAIYWARLDRVWYAATREDAAAAGFDDALLYDELVLAPGARRLPMQAAMRDQAQEAFRLWREKQDRIAY
jgi:tRNA(Arg) A34 adenosine deaminase TadA